MAYVGPHVSIGKGCRLMPQCHVTGHTTMGENNTVFPFATIGSQAEDYHVTGGATYLKIGDNNIFREGVTVNTGTKDDSSTIIGNGCFLMANAHVAHNCELGNNVIMVVGSGLSGYVTVADKVLISGLSGIHQFCRVGRMAVLSGGSTISMDLPPFMIGDGRNGGVRGINKIGMKRNNFSEETIRAITNIYKIFFRSGLNSTNALAKIRAELPQLPEVQEFIAFVESSKRGVLTGHGGRRS
ncbi:MAG: acyl-[acyl-carrier-protein]--UDP-N-acetylglucosamine O-acyltransferase [Lentisphaerae bacterium GWF2_52_8]|nr:MAG: acyl-[acyl-carrier-protein]--UDP-N-acetylglucosamine O-acyltransferase [Lentisphaerae bacterium GWF2_52_8]